nr:immunoglobulin heavy chain junction region [Macaca mulatta]MOW45637.1 immunoglobulin heavy chain junction region [Macaca mulatta]MOW45731.1 immunoglobulin heavy chain junction region [Macaca mulatta]MOW45733.1 immunoglobulin heavy chain junction region [Macaca mulatta]MOW45830.1 immunoglobulin heavy chain junction region [Macaca mulatta]
CAQADTATPFYGLDSW